ncbi:hypothetical protein ACQ4PT_049200 [Festuca glaucescens]
MKVVVVCLLVSSLGLLSAGLAFAAEITKIKASGIIRTRHGGCMYPRTPTSLLGMLSALLFMLAHAVVVEASGDGICCKVRRRNHCYAHWTIESICYVVSCVMFPLAFLLLLHGTFLNYQGWNMVGATSPHHLVPCYCDVVGDGIFSSGAVLVLLSSFLALGYYLALQPTMGILPVGDLLVVRQGIVIGRLEL